MSWITTIPRAEADDALRKTYERISGPDGQIDNILLAHSLRPHSLEGHMALYKNVLHHARNVVPKWFLEALGVYTSQLNRCRYCVLHHRAGLQRQLKDDDRARRIMQALTNGVLENAFTPKECAALSYAQMLTNEPERVSQSMIQRLHRFGWSDGEILEINQVVAYFNYANRTVLGLGVSSEGELLGLSPSDEDDPENWSHR